MINLLLDKANIVTTIGLISGLLGILCAVNSDWELSILFMLLAVFCDIADGVVAKKFRKKENVLLKQVGAQFDSLADLVHSGIAPGIFIYYFTGESTLSLILLLFIVICTFLRLAYFNCVGLTEEGYFYGVPVFYSPMALGFTFLLVSITSLEILIVIYALLVPTLQIMSNIRIRKFIGIGYRIFILILSIEIVYYISIVFM
jgi:CDP-diacylglycerol---serine O-phosphatidyltransferase